MIISALVVFMKRMRIILFILTILIISGCEEITEIKDKEGENTLEKSEEVLEVETIIVIDEANYENKEECKQIFEYTINEFREEKEVSKMEWSDNVYKLAVARAKDLYEIEYLDETQLSSVHKYLTEYNLVGVAVENIGIMEHETNGTITGNIREVVRPWISTRNQKQNLVDKEHDIGAIGCYEYICIFVGIDGEETVPKISIKKFESDPVEVVSTGDYKISLTKVEVTDYMRTTLEIKNVRTKSIVFTINRLGIVTGEGNQHGLAGDKLIGIYSAPDGCNDWTDIGSPSPITLLPNAKGSFTLCFSSSLAKEDELTFFIGLLLNSRRESPSGEFFDYKMVGDQKEHSFDLSAHLE